MIRRHIRILYSLGLSRQASPYSNSFDKLADPEYHTIGLWESLLHEAGHALVEGIPFRRRGRISAKITDAFCAMTSMLLSDWHEVRALAIEFETAKALGCEIDEDFVIRFAASDMKCFTEERAKQALARTRRSENTQRLVRKLVMLLEQP